MVKSLLRITRIHSGIDCCSRERMSEQLESSTLEEGDRSGSICPRDKDIRDDSLQDRNVDRHEHLEELVKRATAQKVICQQLRQENTYLQEYLENIMGSGNVLGK
ncbi:Slo1p Ecym_3503 [Eremothecium cymbalariae DBVPG|uniref:Uncharacterized protein n=1 Tax=Eremothecium cymbalariae (strain CBS 270.75 / DBVPG 7215 / KCTC 17166 / NRRL Y-17582) TaxID=931890 RepID=G8JS62_ERECY|nr:Hypothetical protein Ecym_3503 [Eremothecium cymbalariae DBVPG\